MDDAGPGGARGGVGEAVGGGGAGSNKTTTTTTATGLPLRTSTRILKRPKRDFSPPTSPPKKPREHLFLTCCHGYFVSVARCCIHQHCPRYLLQGKSAVVAHWIKNAMDLFVSVLQCRKSKRRSGVGRPKWDAARVVAPSGASKSGRRRTRMSSSRPWRRY